MVSRSSYVFGGELGRHVVVVRRRIVEASLARLAVVPGFGPPVVRTFARRRDHARDEHQELRGEAIADERRGEGAERLADHDEA